MFKKMAIGMTAVLLFICAVNAATIYVPDDYTTIQDAIDAAVGGDTVIVRPGTYVEVIDLLGKPITVRSEQGAAVTVIDGNLVGSVVMFENGEGADSILDGFTITNGNGTQAGGIHCRFSSSPTITNNIVSGNNTGTHGGGIFCDNGSSPTIVNNFISQNNANLGGGIYCNNSIPIIANNTIVGNTANFGGGVHCTYSSPVIVNTILWYNKAATGPQIWGTPKVACSNVQGGCPGIANINAGPLLVDLAGNDLHLTWDSPCRDAGINHPLLPATDFDGDPRVRFGRADIGADEFANHLYRLGNAAPGNRFSVRVTGTPGAWVVLGEGSGIQDPPYPSSYGPIYIAKPWTQHPLGLIPANGVLIMPVKAPSSWVQGDNHYFQALVSKSVTMATNLMTVTVE